MARTGLPNWFLKKEGNPVLHDESWRETMKRSKWNHMYLPTKNKPEGFNYKTMSPMAEKFFAKTHHIMNHTYSAAAGCSSYHYNVYKPIGTVVRHGRQGSINFDGGRWATFNPGCVPKDARGIPCDSSVRLLAPQGVAEHDLYSTRTISCPPIGITHFNADQEVRKNCRQTVNLHDHTSSPRLRRVQSFDYIKHEKT